MVRRKGSSKQIAVRLISYRPPQPETVRPKPGSIPHVNQLGQPLRIRPRPRLSVTPHADQRQPARIEPDRLTITLPVPPSINHQYATVHGRRVMSTAGRAYKQEVAHHILAALAGQRYRDQLLECLRVSHLALTIQFYFSSAIRRDVDGGLKIAQDAVCGALGVNDNRIAEIHLFKKQDRTTPRIEVSLARATPDVWG